MMINFTNHFFQISQIPTLKLSGASHVDYGESEEYTKAESVMKKNMVSLFIEPIIRLIINIGRAGPDS